jgi:HD-like signal output (HDOD) protein
MQMKKILFVDDEPKILEGIKRMLRPMREQWDVQFATSGPEALRLLQKESFNILVTDMRMPGMDGAELLTLVREQFPTVVRIVLSGYSEQEMVFKSVKAAHQYLSKPCEPKTLIITIENACGLHDWLSNEAITSVVSSMEALPSMPVLYRKIVEELGRKDASVSRIAHTISLDVAMAAKVLQLVNSGFFSLRQHVTDMLQAVSLLGLDTIKALVLSVHIFSQFSLSKASILDIAEVSKHSLRVGLFSRAISIAEGVDKVVIDDAFIGGILHDVGKLILAANFDKQYKRAIHLSGQERISLQEAENQLFNANHCDVGGYFAALWGFPDSIIRAVGFHHESPCMVDEPFSSLLAVFAANIIEHQSDHKQWVDEWVAPDGVGPGASLFGDRMRLWRDVCMKAPEMGAENG